MFKISDVSNKRVEQYLLVRTINIIILLSYTLCTISTRIVGGRFGTLGRGPGRAILLRLDSIPTIIQSPTILGLLATDDVSIRVYTPSSSTIPITRVSNTTSRRDSDKSSGRIANISSDIRLPRFFTNRSE